MEFFTYILQSEVDGSLYIGQTNSLQDRINRHNRGYNKSTKSKKPWKLIFAKKFESRPAACKTEKYLKSLKKQKAVFNWIQDHRDVAQPG
ncbi:MAG: GIY-YIG nuclease family protein [Bacteroidales bacterium]|nr:GIY-YIG nuclease family protein [Bacteroidales bacterium]